MSTLIDPTSSLIKEMEYIRELFLNIKITPISLLQIHRLLKENIQTNCPLFSVTDEDIVVVHRGSGIVVELSESLKLYLREGYLDHLQKDMKS